MKKIIISLAVAALIAGGVFYFMPKETGSSAPKWIASAVVKQSVVQSITATGTVEPVTVVDIGTQVSGILTSLYVDYNSVVKQGEVIAELDKSTLILELNSNKSNLASAKSKLNFQKANYNRIYDLYKKELIADSEYELALFDYEAAKYNVEVAQNSVERSQTNLGYCTIYSPIDGVVLSRNVEEGQTVASSFSTPTLFSVAADLKDMRVIANVDEADIGAVREGQRASFSVDAFPTEVFEGYITQVRQEGVVESNVVTYEVVISAPNPDLKLKPGLTANIEIFSLDKECELTVPSAALSFTPPVPSDGGGAKPMAHRRPNRPELNGEERVEKSVVWILVGDKIEPRRVGVGVSNGIITEIEGLQPSDSVVVGMESTGASLSRGKAMNQGSQNPFAPKRMGPRR